VQIATDKTECELVHRDLRSGRWRAVILGFGSTECRQCKAHLLVEVVEPGADLG
jgi:hypothetical protein